jgi:hypothetical protein
MVTISIINLKLGHFKPTRDADLRIHKFLQLVSQDSHKTMYRNSFDAPLRLILEFRGLSFSFVVYGLDLLVKVWFVSIVLALEVPGLLR